MGLNADMRKRVFIASACVMVWLGLLLVGVWPFNFAPTNKVTWLEGRNGVHFDGYGQIYNIPSGAHDPLGLGTGPFSIEIWIRSAQHSFDFTEIVSFESSAGGSLTLAQSGRDLVLGARILLGDGTAKSQRAFVDNALSVDTARFITIVCGSSGTFLYLDSVLQKSLPELRHCNLGERMLIGHSPTRIEPWSGDLLGLAIYRSSLSPDEINRHHPLWTGGNSLELAKENPAALYPVNERQGNVIHNQVGSAGNLVIPRTFHKQRKSVLESNIQYDRSQLKDVCVNVMGFIPLGFLFATWLQYGVGVPRSRVIILSVIAGVLTSLSIELLQACLPSRDSSLIDLIANSFGTGMGALAARLNTAGGALAISEASGGPYRWIKQQ